MLRDTLYVKAKGSKSRQELLAYLEKHGFNLSKDTIKSKKEIIDGILPIIVDRATMEYHMNINTTSVACAAQNKRIITVEDLYKMNLKS